MSERSLQDIFTIRKFNPRPISDVYLPEINTDIILQWFRDPDVACVFLSADNVYEFIGVGIIENIKSTFFPGKGYFTEYRRYVKYTLLPEYVAFCQKYEVMPSKEVKLCFEQLIAASMGFYFLPDIYSVIDILFPFLKIKYSPDDGNCYFWSIGKSRGDTSKQVRKKIANYLSALPESKTTALKSYLSGCETGEYVSMGVESFQEKFIELIEKDCKSGEIDCNSCIWGGDYFDEAVAEIYDAFVVPLSIDAGRKMKTHDYYIYNSLEEYADREFFLFYLGTKYIRYCEFAEYKVYLSLPVLSTKYQQNIEWDILGYFPFPKEVFIPYVLSKSHINGLQVL